MKPSRILLSLSLCASLTFAWPWPPSLKNLDGMLVRRQDNANDKTSAKEAPSRTAAESAAASTAAASTAAASSAAKSDSAQASETAKASRTDNKASETSAAQTGSDTKPTRTRKGSNGTKVTSKPTKTPIPDDTDPPGGIEMLTPAATSTTFFKIGEDVTLVWNYTSLVVTPSKIDVLATNTLGAWTLTQNASVQETGSVVWRTNKDKDKLLTETYTLVVFDSKAGITAAPEPGKLSPFLTYQFGMYLPREYTPLSDFVCATCNGAVSEMERQTLKFVFAMGTITVLSFTWFAGGFLSIF